MATPDYSSMTQAELVQLLQQKDTDTARITTELATANAAITEQKKVGGIITTIGELEADKKIELATSTK